MADITITDLASHDYTVRLGQTSVSFWSNTLCTVTFSNRLTFGVSKITLSPPEQKNLTIADYVTTDFTPSGSGLVENTPGVHTITIGSGL